MDTRSGYPALRSSQRGFTLVEAAIAVVILMAGLMAATNLILVATGWNTVANHQGATAAAASDQLEELKALPWDALSPGGSLTADVRNFFSDSDIPGVGRVHTRWRIDTVPGRAQLLTMTVRSELPGPYVSRSRAEFTALRSCTHPLPAAPGAACPSPPCCPFPP